MKPSTVLVTGGCGFVGPYLIAALEKTGQQVIALGTSPTQALSIAPEWRSVDLCDRTAVSDLVASVRPTAVYHLAALSSVAASFEDPIPTYMTNVMGTAYLLDALRRQAPTARTLLISSAEVYGGRTSPLLESTPFDPANPYAASKVAAEMIGLEHWKSQGLPVLRARSFNHTGPGQAPHFVVASFAKQIALIESGLQAPVLKVGNLTARRDFLDVRDVVRAYVALMAEGEPGAAYNVCSGQAIPMRALLDGLLSLCSVAIDVQEDPARFRPIDVPELVGSHAALSEATGWKPVISLEQTLKDTLAYWRDRVRVESGRSSLAH
jgi:GDP-4-dehydro-6-deoxy-D-mannose reductase